MTYVYNTFIFNPLGQLFCFFLQESGISVEELSFPLNLQREGEVSLLVLCMLGNFSLFCCCLLTFFIININKKNILGTPSECQTVNVQHHQSVKLFMSKLFAKGYQQTTKIATSMESQ